MIIPGEITDAVGIGMIIAAFFWQKTNKVKGAIKQISVVKIAINIKSIKLKTFLKQVIVLNKRCILKKLVLTYMTL